MLKTITALAAIGVSAVLLVPTVSYADESLSARVSYAGLNLTSDSGQKTLVRRMSFAATSFAASANGSLWDLPRLPAIAAATR